MTYDRLFKEFASALARMDRARGAELVATEYAAVDPYFNECVELIRQRDFLKQLTPHFSQNLDQQFDRALGDLTTRALAELGFEKEKSTETPTEEICQNAVWIP